MIDDKRFETIREESLNRIIDIARNVESKDYFSSNKYLLEGDWFLGNKVGRPSKEAIKQEAQYLFDRNIEIQQDHERILNGNHNSNS